MRIIPAQTSGLAKSRPRGRLKTYLLALALLGVVVAVGCSQGAYPLDFFYEMHYQQYYKSHEPPRLSAPESAVAWFPAPKSTSFTDDGKHLFEVNCSMCHGQGAKGDGPVLTTIMENYGYEAQPGVPPDLTLFSADFIEIVLQFVPTPGGSTRPFGDNSVMPGFGKLLSPEERRLVAEYIETLKP